jgi:hypothetical protein
MKTIPTLFTAVAAVAVFGAATAPAVAATAHPTEVSKHCTRGMTHPNGHRDCGKHKGSMKKGSMNKGGTNKGGTNKGGAKTGNAPSYGHPSASPAPGAGPNGS